MSVSNFGDIKGAVESAMGRSDIPSYVWTFMVKDLNRDTQFLDDETSEMIQTTTNPVQLPVVSEASSLKATRVLSAKLIQGNRETILEPLHDYARAQSETGTPRYYSIVNEYNSTHPWMLFTPAPDGTYDVEVRFSYQRADFSSDTSTNFLVLRYPDLYVYNALIHASVWAADEAKAEMYGVMYKRSLDEAKKDDRQRRGQGYIVSRNTRL
jgi:hypothetical protein